MVKINAFLNQRGSAILISLIIVSISAMTALSSALMVQQIERLNRQARVKSMMSALKANLVMRAHQIQAYVNCDTVQGPSSCELNQSYFEDLLLIPLEHNQCPTGSPTPPCGIVIRDINYSPTPTPTLSASIHYTPLDISVAPLLVDFEIPFDLLQGGNMANRCLDGIFQGYSADTGQILCRPLESCDSHQYLFAFRRQVDALCGNVPPNTFPLDGAEEVLLTHIAFFTETHYPASLPPNLSDAHREAIDQALDELNNPWNHSDPDLRGRVKRNGSADYKPLYEVHDYWSME